MKKENEILRAIQEERRIARAMEAIYRDILTLERGIVERKLASSALKEDLKQPSTEKDLLVPIGGDVFVYANLRALDKVLVNVGADVYISKSKEEAQEFLEKRTSLLEKAYEERLTLLDNFRKKRDEINALILDYQIEMEKRRSEAQRS